MNGADKNPSTKFDTLCARCGLRRGYHSEKGLVCPGPWVKEQAFKKPSDKKG